MAGGTVNLPTTIYFNGVNRLSSQAGGTVKVTGSTRYSYNYSGNLQSITYADGSVEDWSYDFLCNPQTWSNRRGHETFYTYDNDGRVFTKVAG